jgi:hypothetical protein
MGGLSLDNNGIIVEGTYNSVNHATEYYKDLFGPAHGNLFHIDQNLWSPNEKLIEEDNSDMIKPFSEHEVKDALFATEKKSPGPDSILIEFY